MFPRRFLFSAWIIYFFTLSGCSSRPPASIDVSQHLRNQEALARKEGVTSFAAPGIVEPLNGIRRVAAPVSPSGLTPRVLRLFVSQGQRVEKNQLLAYFDLYPDTQKELSLSKAKTESLKKQISILKSQTERFTKLKDAGAFPSSDYEDKLLRVSELESSLNIAKKEQDVINEKMAKAILRAPVSGIIANINAREGEQPGMQGVIDIIPTQDLGILAEVDEQHISGLAVGQKANVRSVNGFFPDSIEARVYRIAQRVTPRRSLIIKPGGPKDAEPRVVEVRLKPDKSQSYRLNGMTGGKVMVSFTRK